MGEGDAKSATYPLHGEIGLPPVNQALGSVEGGFLSGILLAILGREERAANIMYSRNFEEDLLEGIEGTDKPPLRITDLRLAVHLEPGILGRALVPVLGSLPRPISAEGVVRWKRRALGGTTEEFETEEEVRERATAEDLEAFAEQAERKVDRSLEDYPGEAPWDPERLRDPLLRSTTWDLAWEARRDLSFFERVEREFGDPHVGTAAVSFAAAGLLLFVDLDMPGIRESKPFRLAGLGRCWPTGVLVVRPAARVSATERSRPTAWGTIQKTLPNGWASPPTAAGRAWGRGTGRPGCDRSLPAAKGRRGNTTPTPLPSSPIRIICMSGARPKPPT